MEKQFRVVMVADRLPSNRESHIFHLKKPIPSVDEGFKNYEDVYVIHKEQKKIARRKYDWWLEPIIISPK